MRRVVDVRKWLHKRLEIFSKSMKIQRTGSFQKDFDEYKS